MKPERWQKVDQIFQATLQHRDEQKAFLDESCRGDEELRREVESLLAQQSDANEFMEEPAMAVVAKDLADQGKTALLGRNIGPYKITSLLGSGGMGDVFRAKDTNLRRDVAIKILPSEFRTDPDRVGRFTREARL